MFVCDDSDIAHFTDKSSADSFSYTLQDLCIHLLMKFPLKVDEIYLFLDMFRYFTWKQDKSTD